MKKKMLFTALAGVMMAIGLLVIAKMNKNPSSEREMAMKDLNCQKRVPDCLTSR